MEPNDAQRAVADQQLGGLLMWVPGNLWMFLAIGVLFFKWARETE